MTGTVVSIGDRFSWYIDENFIVDESKDGKKVNPQAMHQSDGAERAVRLIYENIITKNTQDTSPGEWQYVIKASAMTGNMVIPPPPFDRAAQSNVRIASNISTPAAIPSARNVATPAIPHEQIILPERQPISNHTSAETVAPSIEPMAGQAPVAPTLDPQTATALPSAAQPIQASDSQAQQGSYAPPRPSSNSAINREPSDFESDAKRPKMTETHTPESNVGPEGVIQALQLNLGDGRQKAATIMLEDGSIALAQHHANDTKLAVFKKLGSTYSFTGAFPDNSDWFAFKTNLLTNLTIEDGQNLGDFREIHNELKTRLERSGSKSVNVKRTLICDSLLLGIRGGNSASLEVTCADGGTTELRLFSAALGLFHKLFRAEDIVNRPLRLQLDGFFSLSANWPPSFNSANIRFLRTKEWEDIVAEKQFGNMDVNY